MTTLPRPHPGTIPPTGLLIVAKPQGLTSHDVVARVRRLAGTKKVGHAGTLDPMATGVLVLGIGRATRLLTFVVGADKTYTATIRLGQATVTDDAEGEVIESRGAAGVTPTSLTEKVSMRIGPLLQRPSAVSAIKIDGQRAYARVRAGEEVDLPARPVTVHRFEILGAPRALTVPGRAAGDDVPCGSEGDDAMPAALPDVPVLDVDVLVECSSGTYIRALARDIGADLGTGGHLTMLRRDQVGPFTLDEAATLEQLADSVQAANDAARPAETASALPVLSLTEATTRLFPSRVLDEATTRDLRIGRPIAPTGTPGLQAALAPDGRVVALIEDRGAHARPVLVLDPA